MEANPSSPSPNEVTRILSQVSRGVDQADRRLLEIVYSELKRIAAAKMAAQEPDHTLQPTALVHEAYLRLLGSSRTGSNAYRDSGHFFAAAAAAMRSILVDHARRKGALKRGPERARVTLHPDLMGQDDSLDRILQVHEALEALAADHPRSASIVELLFFGGLSAAEAASLLGLSSRTVEREWRFARAWLVREMEKA
jgi:RNA polymerase sigma factor (TIGR02999 family)